MQHQYVSYGDLVVMTSGAPFWVSGTTNTIRVENIGDVLVRAHVGYGAPLQGTIALVPTADSKKPQEIRGQIIVIPACDDAFIPFIQEAAGVILQNPPDDIQSEKKLKRFAKEHNISSLVRADNALRYLREGQLVTLDPEKALVYKGMIR